MTQEQIKNYEFCKSYIDALRQFKRQFAPVGFRYIGDSPPTDFIGKIQSELHDPFMEQLNDHIVEMEAKISEI